MSSTSPLLLRGGTVLFHQPDDHVTALLNTDILIQRDTIVQIGQSILAPGAKILDCAGKIISPGFIDTHHHLWQTQLKGRIADATLWDYFPLCNMQSSSYTPEDMYWGQMGGCLEALDAGTTMVVDHAHGTTSAEHASNALAATAASGLRAIFCYNYILRIQQWDKSSCIPDQDLMPDWATKQIDNFATLHPFGDGRVHFGFGFDLFFLPRKVVIGIFEKVRKAGVKLITIHVSKSPVLGSASVAEMLRDYGLLAPDILVSHGTGLSGSEKAILSNAGIYISSTPTTEAQMGLGYPTAFEQSGVKSCLGVDCHASDSAFLPEQMKLGLQLARAQTNEQLILAGKAPKSLRGSVEGAFNLGTIAGARAVGMEAEIGSVAVGKKADLVVFDATGPGMVCAAEHDPVVAVVRHSSVGDIKTVIVGGRIVKEGGRLVDVDVRGEKGLVVDPRVLHKGGKTGNVGWSDVVVELVRSRKEIQARIERQDIEKGRELIAGMFHVDQTNLVDVI